MMRKIKAIIIFFIFTISIFGQIVEGDDGLYYDENGDLFTGVYKEFYDGAKLKMEMLIKKENK